MSSNSNVTYSNPYHSPIPDSYSPNHHSLLPTYPDVVLKRLPFYDIESTLLKPCSLQPNCNARFQVTLIIVLDVSMSDLDINLLAYRYLNLKFIKHENMWIRKSKSENWRI
jgi:hypothetical protein